MSALLSVILLGFFLGMRHATDSDHVVAVTTIVSRQRTLRAAVLIGALWGIGHTVTIVVIGGAIVLFSVVIPPRVGLTMELSVAVMLILLGALNLTGIMRQITEALGPARRGDGRGHSHPHSHNDYYVHSHPHAHGPEEHGHGEEDTPPGRLDRRFGRLGLYQVLRPLIVGMVHGLAGSMAKEYPHWRVRLLDLEAGVEAPPRESFALPFAGSGDPLACRDGTWFERTLVPAEPLPRGDLA
jgi:high-affinity nickel-transport protein